MKDRKEGNGKGYFAKNWLPEKIPFVSNCEKGCTKLRLGLFYQLLVRWKWISIRRWERESSRKLHARNCQYTCCGSLRIADEGASIIHSDFFGGRVKNLS